MERDNRSSGSADKATQGTEARGGERRQLAWAEASIWTDRMMSALGNGVKGGKWFSLIDKVHRPSTLEIAWRSVARNKGAAGVDRMSVERFAAQETRDLAELHEQLKDGSDQPHPVKRVEIPKGDGKTRPLGIPTVKDRVVQAALKMVIEPIFETRFRPGSFGFRPGRGCKDALREVDRLIRAGYTHVVDADLKGYPRDKPGGMFRQYSTRSADGSGGRIDQRRPCAVPGRAVPETGHHGRDGALDAGGGHPAGGCPVAAAGKPLSASARPPDGGRGPPQGALCG